jgi:hypothetical protein
MESQYGKGRRNITSERNPLIAFIIHTILIFSKIFKIFLFITLT